MQCYFRFNNYILFLLLKVRLIFSVCLNIRVNTLFVVYNDGWSTLKLRIIPKSVNSERLCDFKMQRKKKTLNFASCISFGIPLMQKNDWNNFRALNSTVF
jgi:hypothetical protein